MKDRTKRNAASQLAKIFEDHFAGLSPEKRASRERAFDRAIAKIGFPSKSSEQVDRTLTKT